LHFFLLILDTKKHFYFGAVIDFRSLVDQLNTGNFLMVEQ